jgi:GTP-binding protein
MASYLSDRQPLRMVSQLVDARHKPSDLDLEMLSLLDEAEVPTLVVATKADKLKQSERKPNLKAIQETLRLDSDALILPFSAVTGEGRKDLWEVIEDLLKESG